VDPENILRLEGLGQLKDPMISMRTCDAPARGIVPHTTTSKKVVTVFVIEHGPVSWKGGVSWAYYSRFTLPS
jgi:hypothetical protein